MTNIENLSLEEQREYEKAQIDMAIDKAIENAIPVSEEETETLIEKHKDYDNAKEHLKKLFRLYAETGSLGGENPDSVIDFKSNDDPSCIEIENPQMYPYVLAKTREKLGYARSRNSVEETTAHELLHSVPMLGKDTGKVKYGVRIGKYQESGEATYHGYVRFEGKITIGELLDSLINPDIIDDLDVTDIDVLEKLLAKQKRNAPEVYERIYGDSVSS